MKRLSIEILVLSLLGLFLMTSNVFAECYLVDGSGSAEVDGLYVEWLLCHHKNSDGDPYNDIDPPDPNRGPTVPVWSYMKPGTAYRIGYRGCEGSPGGPAQWVIVTEGNTTGCDLFRYGGPTSPYFARNPGHSGSDPGGGCPNPYYQPSFPYTEIPPEIGWNPKEGWCEGEEVEVPCPDLTDTCPYPTVTLYIPPPTATAASDVQSTSFSATWSAPDCPGNGYKLDVATDSAFTAFVTGYEDLDVSDVTTYSVTGLSPNTLYYYRVRAYHRYTETNNSNTINVTTLANAPGAASFSNVTQSSIQANWTANGNPPGTEYYCENITAGSNSGWNPDSYSWASTGLSCGTLYSFQVKARNGAGQEAGWTDLGSQETAACPPGYLSVTPPGGLTSVGPPGGPFAPDSEVYTLENTGGTAISWSATLVNSQAWVDLSQTQGILDPDESTTVTVSINANADGLPSGLHSETVSFAKDGTEQETRSVNLTVLSEYALTITVDPAGTGTVSLNPSGGIYVDGTVVTLTATATDPYFEFNSWSGDLSGTVNPDTITMDSDKNITANFSPKDSDGDGVSDLDEDAGPNGGDANGDGILDSQQPNVFSVETYDAQHDVVFALEDPPGATLTACQAVANPHPADCPSWVDFPYGFFEFTIQNVGAGGAATLKLHLPAGSGQDTYYRYGPTPADPNDHWYNFMFDAPTQTGAEINGDVITLHYVDGQRGDNDLDDTNGTIHDPGGPGLMSGGGTGGTAGGGPSGGVTGGDGGGGTVGGCFVAGVDHGFCKAWLPWVVLTFVLTIVGVGVTFRGTISKKF